MNESVTAYLGLGSNLADPIGQLHTACDAIAQLAQVAIITCSALVRSPPMGPAKQPDYINAVMAINTTLTPIALLHALQAIEQAQGRVRLAQRWTARTLDVDILLYGDMQIQLPELCIPHPGLAVRAFVLYPLYSIAPTLVIPGLGTLETLVNHCPLNGLTWLDA